MKTIYLPITISFLTLTSCTNIAAYDWLHRNRDNSPIVINDSKNKLIHNDERIIVQISPDKKFNEETFYTIRSLYEENLEALGYNVITKNTQEKATLVAKIDLIREEKTGTQQVNKCSYQDVQVMTDKGFVTENQNVCTPTDEYYTYYRYENDITFIKLPSICNNPTARNPYCISNNSDTIYNSASMDTNLYINDSVIFTKLALAFFATYPSNQSYSVYSTLTPMGYQPAIFYNYQR